MIPLPTNFFGAGGGPLSPPALLDKLSAGTTVIFAGSVARQLKAAANFAYTAGDKGSGSSAAKITFKANGLADQSILLALATAQTSGNQSTGLMILNDQTGNANYLGRPSESHYCPLTTPAGTLNASATVAGGATIPMFSTGYNGLQAATSGPYLTCGTWAGSTTTDLNPGNMAVSFGAVSTFWSYDVVRLNSGTGNINGRISSFTHTGDSNDNTTTTSAALSLLNGSTTSGAVRALADAATLSNGIAPVGSLALIGSIFDGAHHTLRINGVAQTPVTYSATLGAGGIYALGEIAGVGAFGSAPLAGDRVEHLCGTTLATADLNLIEANLMAFYGIA